MNTISVWMGLIYPSIQYRRGDRPSQPSQVKTVVKLKDRTFELHFAWLVNTFYTFLDTFIDGGSPVWYARVVKEKKKKERKRWQQRKRRNVYKGTNEDWRCRRKRNESRCELAAPNANGGLHAHHCDLFFHARPHASWMSQQPALCLLCSHNCQEILYLTNLYLQL